MKTIKESEKIIDVILDDCFSEKSVYKESIFLIYLKYKNTNLVYSTLTNGLYSLDEEEFLVLKNPNSNNLEIKKELISKHLLVDVEKNEYNIANQVKKFCKSFRKDEEFINSFTILTTTDCNARCYYCYEYGLKRIPMSFETSTAVAEYIKRNYCGKKVFLKWFGGEPLYNYSVIDNITSILRDNNIDFESQMTTNGYLFDKDIVNRSVKDWNLKKVQVTLDGTEEIYNKYKAYIHKDCKSPFIRVINNIDLLINAGITVNIRLNMDDNNAADLYELVKWISERFPEKSNLHIYTAIIFDRNKEVTLESRQRILNSFAELTQLIYDKHLSRYRLKSALYDDVACMANNSHAVVITPQGDLQRCEHIADDEVYGNIFNDDFNDVIYNSWFVGHDEIVECKNCEFFPTCKFLKKCKTFIRCTEDERIGKKLGHYDAMRWEYDKYLENS